jgi:Transposase IS116/IS110/IS902 family
MGALPRGDTPRERLPCLGLIPAASASGARRPQGPRTHAGHIQARRALVEGAWASRSRAQGRRHWPLRLAQPPQLIQDLRGHAHVRLGQRSRPLGARGTQAPLVPVAMARELAGGLWAMAHQLPGAASGARTERACPRNAAGVRRASEETQPRCGGTLGSVQRLREGYACRERGRHPTEARKVGTNPRRAAGATVVAAWLRLCRGTQAQHTTCGPEKSCSPLLTLEVIATLGFRRGE